MFNRAHRLSLNILRKEYSSLCNLGWVRRGLRISLVFWINVYLVKGKSEKWVCVHICNMFHCWFTVSFIKTFCILSFHAGVCLIYFLKFLGKKRLHRTSTWTCRHAVLKYSICLFWKLVALCTELHFPSPASARCECAIRYQIYQKY